MPSADHILARVAEVDDELLPTGPVSPALMKPVAAPVDPIVDPQPAPAHVHDVARAGSVVGPVLGAESFPPPPTPEPLKPIVQLPPPLRPDLEKSLREVAQVDRVLPGRFTWAKKAIVAFSRPFLRRQATYNERNIAALRELATQQHLTTARAERLEQALVLQQHQYAQFLGAMQGVLGGQIRTLSHGIEALGAAQQVVRAEVAANRATLNTDRAAMWERQTRLEGYLRGAEQRLEEVARDMRSQFDAYRTKTDQSLAKDSAAMWERQEATENSIRQAQQGVEEKLGQLGKDLAADRTALWGRQENLEKHLRDTQEDLRAASAAVTEQMTALQELVANERVALWDRQGRLETFLRATQDQVGTMKQEAQALIDLRTALQTDQTAWWDRLTRLEESVTESLSTEKIAVWDRIKRIEDSVTESLSKEKIDWWDRLKRVEESVTESLSTEKTDLWDRLKRVEDSVTATLSTEKTDLWNRLKRVESSVTETLSAEKIALWERLNVVEAELRATQHRVEEDLGATDRIRQSLDRDKAGLKSAVDEQVTIMRAMLNAAPPQGQAMPAPTDSTKSGKKKPASAPEAVAVGSTAPAGSMGSDLDYYQFEMKFRGDPEELRQRQKGYIDLLTKRLGKKLKGLAIADLGCGSGVFVEMLASEGANARGVDINQAAVLAGQGVGRSLERGDLFAWLDAQAPASYHAFTAFQVVEHLNAEQLRRLAAACSRALAPGGVVLFETLNPGSLSAWRWYLLDWTHQTFLYPEVLEHIIQGAGFVEAETVLASTPPEYQRLNVELPEAVASPALRENFQRLNEMLYGPMEYSLSARKPG